MRYALLITALAAVTNFTTASVIQPRDDKPAFDEPFVLSVWFKLDPEEFKKDKSLAITLKGGMKALDTETEILITGDSELKIVTSTIAGDVAFLGDLVFDSPTDQPRNTTVTLVHEHKFYRCGIKVPRETPVLAVQWVVDSGLDMYADKGAIPGREFLGIECEASYHA